MRVSVIGGGQLARMMVPAASELGIHLRAQVEDFNGSTGLVLRDCLVGSPKSLDDVRRLVYGLDGTAVQRTDILTFEHEHIPQDIIQQIESEGFAVHPSSSALLYAQDKFEMRRKLKELSIPVPNFELVKSASDVKDFLAKHGKAVAKTTTGGYDGKGVAFLDSQQITSKSKSASAKTAEKHIASAYQTVLGWLEAKEPVILEEYVAFTRELSQVCARTPSGKFACYPLVQTVQQDGVCKTVIAPAQFKDKSDAKKLTGEAEMIAQKVGESLGITGIFAVELFETADGKLLVNELAMRPHNTGHWTINGAVTSQFEQHLRAILDLPLGSTELTAQVTVMENILGSTLESLNLVTAKVLALDPNIKINLYDKSIKPGRKLGHINISGDIKDISKLQKIAKKATNLYENTTQK